MNNMYNYPTYSNSYLHNANYSTQDGDRLVGGFAFPFLLGGVTGAAIAPAFFNNGYGYNRPYYGPYYRPYYGPYYGPYYR